MKHQVIGIPSLFSFELKEGTKQYYIRPFPVPSVHKDATAKENRLCDLGVLEFQPVSAWASPWPKTEVIKNRWNEKRANRSRYSLFMFLIN
jgi:hypothetical protein